MDIHSSPRAAAEARYIAQTSPSTAVLVTRRAADGRPQSFPALN